MTRYRTRDVEVDVMTWEGDNLDEALDFLGSAFFGVRSNEKRVQILLIDTPGNPAAPTELRPGGKLVRVEGAVSAWSPEAFAALFERID